MNPFDAQHLLTFACVATAAGVLVRRFVMMIRNPEGSGCHSGGCQSCPSNSPKAFVALDDLMPSPFDKPQADDLSSDQR